MTSSPPTGHELEPQDRGLKATLFGLAVWAILIAISILLEYLLNSGSSVGSGGFAPIPVIFASALFLGWIPALIVGLRKFRSR